MPAGALLDGVLENYPLRRWPVAQLMWLVWLVPAIGPAAFEVGPEVALTPLSTWDPQAQRAFVPLFSRRPVTIFADIYQLARQLLQGRWCCSPSAAEAWCTAPTPRRFYFLSARAWPDRAHGASLIWLEATLTRPNPRSTAIRTNILDSGHVSRLGKTTNHPYLLVHYSMKRHRLRFAGIIKNRMEQPCV